MCAESGDIFKSNSMTNLFSNEYVCGIVLPLGKISCTHDVWLSMLEIVIIAIEILKGVKAVVHKVESLA